VILGKKIIPVAIEGFLQALEEKATQYDYGDIRLSFIEFFRQFNLEQIMELMENILESCHSDASEISVIKENIESHSRILHAIFKKV
jgi:hypothetical protein